MAPARYVYLETEGKIANIVLNRPEVLNAANVQWVEDLHRALDELETTPGVRVVIVSGQGRSFSTGIDLKALAAGEIQIAWFRRWDEAMLRIEQLDAVSIAKIHGYALGGGLQVALSCDLRMATPDARMGLPAVLEALIPGMGTYRLPRFIGLGRAKRLILTGEVLDADEALRMGMVDWVVPADQLEATMESVIAGILKGSGMAQRFSKRLATSAFETNLEAAFSKLLADQQQCLSSTEHKEAMREYRNRKK